MFIIHQRSFVLFVYRTHISFFIRGGQHALIKGKVEEVKPFRGYIDSYNNRKYMGLEVTNKVLLRFKSACSATVTSWKIKISLEANSDMMLSKRRITKAQISPRRSAPLLFAPLAPKTSFLALRTLCYPLHGMFFD